jgi:hypothetical protein
MNNFRRRVMRDLEPKQITGRNHPPVLVRRSANTAVSCASSGSSKTNPRRFKGLRIFLPKKMSRVPLSDGNNVKYLVKHPQAEKLEATPKEAVSIEKVSSWELEKLGTALSVGNSPLPMGRALKIAH